PVLEAASIGAYSKTILRCPFCGVEIQQGRLETFEDVATNIEEARSTWAAQVFATSRREYVTADPVNVDGHLSDRLAGVYQVDDACFACDLSNFSNRIHKSTIGRYVRNGNEPDALIDGLAQGFERYLTMCIIGNDFDNCAGLFCYLQEGDVVACILCHSCEYTVSWSKRDGIEGHIPGAGGIFHDGDLVPSTTDQCSRGVIGVFNCIVRAFGCLIATDLCFEL